MLRGTSGEVDLIGGNALFFVFVLVVACLVCHEFLVWIISIFSLASCRWLWLFRLVLCGG